MDRRPFLFWLSVAACGACTAACLLGRETLLLGSALWLLRWPLAAFWGLLALRAVRRRPRLALVAAGAAALLAGQWINARSRRAAPEPVPAQDAVELTVLTHNVLFRGGDPDRTLETLVTADADVVALQEVTPAWVARLERALRPDHPHALLEPRHGALGYALYSRYPLTGAASLRRRHRGFAQCARLELPSGPVPICNVHLATPPLTASPRALEENARVRAQQWAEVKGFLDAGGGRAGPALAVGDFNTGDYEPLLRRITTEFVDTAGSMALLPARTFPNPAVTRFGPLVRIDYVLVRGPAEPVAVTVGSATGSDHLPVRAVLRLRNTGPMARYVRARAR